MEAMPNEEEMNEQMKKEREMHAMDTQMQLSPMKQEEKIKEYVDSLVDTKEEMPREVLRAFEILFSRDIPLTNLRDWELDELYAMFRQGILKYKMFHPRPNSIWQGETRKVLLGDARQPLTNKQQEKLDALEIWFYTRIRRARNGTERRYLTQQTHVSRLEDSKNKQQESFKDRLFGF